jgi:AraC family transcriptional regulator
MEADIKELYNSPICNVHNFLCRCRSCSTSETEYGEDFAVAYIRKGNFQFNVFRHELDAFHGLFLINKPRYEYRVKHVHNFPDECTIFSIPDEVVLALQEQTRSFDWFFNDPDRQSVLLRATPSTEYLHHSILSLLQSRDTPRLWVEALITELLLQVLSSKKNLTHIHPFTTKQKTYYMPVIERVKSFMNDNFMEDISLSQLAELGNMSVFHFNRLFKKITNCTPYKYLLCIRLQLARIQIRNTSQPITEVAFSSGFKSLDHFSTTYKSYFGKAPSADRL